jgi:glycosyltransferase involved in cell wall biosynthesis
MAESPLVSVMVTSYNQEDILPKAIDSVLQQTYHNIQVVIADDASTDGSQELIHHYAQTYPNQIKPLFADQNQGIVKNKNRGFRACEGEFITYLDGDDYFFPEKIERELQVFRDCPQFDVIYSNFVFVDDAHRPIKTWNDQDADAMPVGTIFEAVFCKNFPNKTLYRNELMKAHVLKAINYYNEQLTAYEDWDSRIRMSKLFGIGYSNYVGTAYVDDSRGLPRTTKHQRLIQNMRQVVNMNRHLLNDLPPYKRLNVLRTINALIAKKELAESPHLLNPSLWRYVFLSGDIHDLKKMIRKPALLM